MREEDKTRIRAYESYPEGSYQKHLYDEYFLPKEEYIRKYYKNYDQNRWNKWMDNIVYPAFDKQRRDIYLNFLYKIKPSFVVNFNKLDMFWDKIKNDDRFDTELKYFFSFLCSTGFFNDISFDSWLNLKNWQHPWYNEYEPNVSSILEIINYDYGINYLKVMLLDMPWLNK
jgi:hypothetical protein